MHNGSHVEPWGSAARHIQTTTLSDVHVNRPNRLHRRPFTEEHNLLYSKSVQDAHPKPRAGSQCRQ